MQDARSLKGAPIHKKGRFYGAKAFVSQVHFLRGMDSQTNQKVLCQAGSSDFFFHCMPQKFPNKKKFPPICLHSLEHKKLALLD